MLSLACCEDFVEIPQPSSDLTREKVFNDDNTAVSTMDAVYHQMQSSATTGFASGGPGSITLLASLTADDLKEFSSSAEDVGFYYNEIIPFNATNLGVWSSLYHTIYQVNAVLEGIAASTELSDVVKEQLEGEAKFVRAFCYFYLTNLYGDVPLITSTDYRENSAYGRTAKADVYQRILNDLMDSRNLLGEDYSSAGSRRTRPIKWTACALLARVYLYIGNLEEAEAMATEVITSGLYELSPLEETFLANSVAAIWQLLPVDPRYNTWEGYYLILQGAPTAPSSMAMSQDILNSFEEGDIRRTHWTGTFEGETATYVYPYKYKVKSGTPLVEYSMVLRLAEQYLIRAEARAGQGNSIGAKEDLNKIRNRAGLANDNSSNSEELIDAILHERRVELFTEWGHRWMDLKRTGRIDEVLNEAKPGWESTDALWPIPEQEILSNPQLVQNPGY